MLTLFLPDQQGADVSILAKVGLESFTSNTPTPMSAESLGGDTPGKTPGMFWYFGQPRSQPYQPEQTWVAAKPDSERGLKAGRFWFCLENTSPADLARPRQVESLSVPCDDGHEWLVPVARELPRTTKLDDHGEPVSEVARDYREYYELANAFMHEMVNLNTPKLQPLKIRDAWKLATLGLGTNYLLSREIIDGLGLIQSDDVLFWLCGASFELPRMVEVAESMGLSSEEKKTLTGIPVTSSS